MRKAIEIPAAGQSQVFSFTGQSIIVEQVPAYDSFEDVPLLSFDSPGDQLPALIRSIYGSNRGKFNKIYVTGTDASAGDTMVIFSTNACLDDFINYDSFLTQNATLKASFSEPMDDDVFQLSELQIVNANGGLPSAMYITARGGAVAYAFDSDPEQADGLGHVLLDAETQKIEGVNFITAFRSVAAVASETPELTFTMQY